MSQLLLNTPDKRRGFFKVSVRRGGLTQEEAAAIFDGFIPMHIESDFYGGEVTYYGTSPHFDEVDFGFVTPEYRPILTVNNRTGGVVEVCWLREGEREPVQYLQEPDWDAVRNAVEKVIRRHEIELKVSARRKAVELEKQEKREREAVVKRFMDETRKQRQIAQDSLNGMRNMFGGWPAGMQGFGFGGLNAQSGLSHARMREKLFGEWDPAAYR